MPNEVAFIHSELGGKMNLVELLFGDSDCYKSTYC
jgi:hypothetical protein